MAKMPPIRVALDLETTGLHPEQDVILEVAAIKFQGSEILESFESLVAPRRPLPYRVQRLTGITPELLDNAPSIESIAPKLQRFLGDFPIVGHSIPFDASFLQKRGLARTNPLIDTFELASVMLPSISSYNLGQVASSLGLEVPEDRHRAMVDTVLAMRVFLLLNQRLQAVDLSLLKDLANLDAPRTWPLLHFFRQELRTRLEQEGVQRPADIQRGSFGNLFAVQLGMDPRILSFAIARSAQPEPEAQPEPVTHSDGLAARTPVTEYAVVQQIESQVEVLAEGTRPGTQAVQEVQEVQEVQQPPDGELQAESDEQHIGVVQPQEQPSQATPQGYQTAREAIHSALEQQTPLMLEVTTGSNDYTPALLPALEWLRDASLQARDSRQAERLVISCANHQGARRLIESVLPRLQLTLNSHFSVAYRAEREGYLCPHRWFGAALHRTSGELTAEQARGMAKVGLWAQQTLTGEKSELNLFTQEMPAWERICSGIEHIPLADSQQDTIYQRCTYRSKGYCFVSLADERVRAAQIIVTTHMGLFDDLSSKQPLLSDISRRVILDADTLEEENARWTSAELAQDQLITLLRSIGTELPDGRYQGMFALAAPSLRERGPSGLSTSPTISKAELDTRMLSWFQSLRQACAAVERLFVSYQRLLEDHSQQHSNGNSRDKTRGNKNYGGAHSGYSTGQPGRGNERNDATLRFTGDIRTLTAWSDTERAWQLVAHRLQTVIDVVHEAEKTLLANRGRKKDVGSSEESIVASELAAIAHQLLKRKQLGQQAMALTEGDVVYWLRIPPVQTFGTSPLPASTGEDASIPSLPPVLYSQVIQNSTLLKRFLHPEKTGTVFVGTSLSVDSSFSFYRGRFGLEHELCPAFSVVTEHHEQTLLYIANDVPEPNMPQYQRQLDEALLRLATTLQGRTIALFTSHAALRSSYAAIKQNLENQGILVLGQGVDGSPRQLISMFQGQERVVVLGAGNFWDGVEDLPCTPTGLFIARLPMPVLNDPPTAARAEHYSDQLHQLTIPLAALRLKRSLNRLAWNDSQRNSIVLFDRRVLSKEYGPTVLHSLPRCSVRQGAASHMPEVIQAWLGGEGAWE